MHRAREHFLAGAGLAQQHHRRIGRRHPLDHPANLEHLGVAREQAVERRLLPVRVQAAVLLLQLVHPERALDHQLKDVGLERLREEVVGAQFNRLQGILAILLPGQHDHLGVGRDRKDLLQGSKALVRIVRTRRQAQVHRHDRGLEAAQLRDRALAVRRHGDFIAVERPLHLFLQRGIVLDDQQRPAFFAHDTALISSIATGSSTARAAGTWVAFGVFSTSRTVVPRPTALSTSMRPPTPFTYC